MINQDEYVKQLEKSLAAFLEPIKNIPFSVAIKVISGHEVVSFGAEGEADRLLLSKLSEGISEATKVAYQVGIFTSRPNEVGNHIEPFVKEALNKVGLRAEIPLTSNGKHQSAGYPDISIEDGEGRVTYLECKTYNKKSVDSSFRAFYFQPSDNSKITADARHLMVSFEIVEETREGKPVFVPVHWKLYTLEKMLVQIKHEFNASNKEMYKPEALLAEGGIEE